MIKANPPTQETILFRIAFEAQFWNTPPCIDILVDQVYINTLVIQNIQEYEFRHTCDFTNHELVLIRRGKTDAETRAARDGSYDTQTLTLTEIFIDNINVKNIVLDRCVYFPQYPEPWATEQKIKGNILESSIPGETIFGHNGTWIFKFQSPFYKFVVDCVRGPR